MKKHNLILFIIFFGLALSSCSKDDDNPEVENQEITLTDADGNILALPPGGPFDLDGAGVGTCLIWYLRYEDNGEFSGAEVGNNASD